MNLAVRFAFVGILSSIFGSVLGSEPAAGRVSEEEGFVDVDLPIASATKGPGGVTSIAARGKIDGVVVGLAIDFYPEWKRQKLGDGDASFYLGKATIRSLGAESDRFLQLLAQRYKVAGVRKTMLLRVAATAAGLNDDPSHILEAPVKMKFFFESEVEDRYAEVFINVDVAARLLQFNEKDPDYRKPLLRALSEGT